MGRAGQSKAKGRAAAAGRKPRATAATAASLRREVTRLRRVLDTIPGLIWSANADGGIEFVSKRWLEYTGLTLAEVEGWRWSSSHMLHPDDRQRFLQAWRAILASGQPGFVQGRLRRVDESYGWHLFQLAPLRGVRRNRPQWWGLTVDIEDIKKVLRDLELAKEMFAQAERISQTGSFSWRFETDAITWSEEMYRIFDIDPGAAPSWALTRTRLHPEDIGIFEHHRRTLPRNGGDFSYEHRLLLPGGRVKYVRVMGNVVTDPMGRQLEVFGAVSDVTDRVRAAAALQASERLARGQLNALTSVLSTFADDCDEDRFLEQVLRTIIAELSAHSIRVWTASERASGFNCFAECVDGAINFHKNGARARGVAWSRIFRGGKSCAVGTLSSDPPRISVEADQPDRQRWEVDTSDPIVRPVLVRWAREGIRTVLWIPMLMAGKVVGCLTINFMADRAFRVEEMELARALAHQVALAIQVARLSRDTRDAAVVEERNRLARDIHDTLAQALTGVIVQLEASEDAITRGWERETNAHVSHAKRLAREGLREARRSVSALRPGGLKGTGLDEALGRLVRRMTKGTRVASKVVVKGLARRLAPTYEENLLRIGQEAITNALRHARAERLDVGLTYGKTSVRLTVQDDGRGMPAARAREGLGLRGIKERVESMGARLSIRSVRGRGTRVSVAIRLDAVE